MKNQTEVIIYTDGACSGNPGPGGYAAILLSGEHRKEISAGYRRTTNNRMEMMAIVAALKALKKSCRVKLYTDSRYIVDSITKGWVHKWKANGWMRTKNDPALNRDLWEELLKEFQRHRVEIHWVAGHSGIPENEQADKLAVAAAQQPDLLVDEVYEKENPEK